MNGRTIALTAHIVNALLLAAIFIFSVLVYDQLPARIPFHYNVEGLPDSWTGLTMATWLAAPLIFAGITGLFYFIGLFIPWFRKKPEWVNMPPKSRERFLKLSEEERGAVLKYIAAFLFWFPVPANLMFLCLRYSEYRFIVSSQGSFGGMWCILISLAGIPLIIILMIRGIRRYLNSMP